MQKSNISIVGLPGYLLLLVLSALIDGTAGALLFILLILFCGLYRINRCAGIDKVYTSKLFYIVSLGYLISSLIISRNYLDGNNFVVADSLQYLEHLKLRQFDFDIYDIIKESYLSMNSLNILHEIYVRALCIYANTHLNGASAYFLTVAHTFWGIFAIMCLYRILLKKFDPSKAYKYTLLFAFLSPFYFYSCVIIRDIIIAYFFMRCFEILTGDFKMKGVFLMFLFSVITLGLRLYSGIFLFSFIGVYFYKKFESSKLEKWLLPISLILLGLVFSAGIFSELLESTSEEIEYYQEFDAERASGGLSGKLLSLPPVVKQVAMFFYSQIMPFPCYTFLQFVKSLTQLFEALTVTVFPVWWFSVFYTFIYVLLIKKGYKTLSNHYRLLLCFVAAFIVLNTNQIDVRRLMCVYPIIYLVFLQFMNSEIYSKPTIRIREKMLVVYVILNFVYFVIK